MTDQITDISTNENVRTGYAYDALGRVTTQNVQQNEALIFSKEFT
ncbi:MAG: hypothetical protein IJ274_12730 [Lachnospiraceae bacterium]|nr:hypothetical protein [Lachnospiraceae bacterium]